MFNKVLFNKEMTEKLLKGMEITYEAVSNTLGSSGRNAIFRRYGNPMITNDGVSIAKEINLEDPFENMGADLMKQAAEATNNEAGDGTTTSIVLSFAGVKEGLRKIEKGINPMKLRREMMASCEEAIEYIKSVSVPVKTDEELFNVANISVEDEKIAKIVSDAVKKAGVDGNVIVEESSGFEIVKEEIPGLQFDRGYVSPYMVNEPIRQEAIMENVPVLVTDKNINMVKDILPLIEELHKRGTKQLFIVAEDVSGEFLATAIANRLKGTFYIVAVKKPYAKEMLDDIAVLVKANPLTEEKGQKEFVPMNLNDLGVAKKVIVTKDSCTIVGTDNEEKIQERVKAIKNEIKNSDGYIKERLKERLAKLLGGVVVIKVGAPTEADMKYKKLKIDDAVNAAKAALEEGIIVGGGRVLYDFSKQKIKSLGDAVVKYACGRPMRKIIENSGSEPEDILSTLNDGEVYDSGTGEIVKDPMKLGIIDPAKVTRCALKNSTSMASIFLTSHCAIADIPEKGIDKKDMV